MRAEGRATLGALIARRWRRLREDALTLLRGSRQRRVQRAPVLLACLAMLLHAFAVQTHVHISASPSTADAGISISNGAPAADRQSEPGRAADKSQCALCQALAGGGFTSPLVASFGHQAPFAEIAAEIAEAGALAHRAAFFWRSRAPPL